MAAGDAGEAAGEEPERSSRGTFLTHKGPDLRYAATRKDRT
jgi:hypothetical protein